MPAGGPPQVIPRKMRASAKGSEVSRSHNSKCGRNSHRPQKECNSKGMTNPRNVSEVKSFLGLWLYYQRFVPFQPLNQLCEKGQTFRWTTTTENALQQLNMALTEAPVMAYPITGIPLLLDTDASNCTIAALLQTTSP